MKPKIVIQYDLSGLRKTFSDFSSVLQLWQIQTMLDLRPLGTISNASATAVDASRRCEVGFDDEWLGSWNYDRQEWRSICKGRIALVKSCYTSITLFRLSVSQNTYVN